MGIISFIYADDNIVSTKVIVEICKQYMSTKKSDEARNTSQMIKQVVNKPTAIAISKPFYLDL